MTRRRVDEYMPKAGPVKVTHTDGTVEVKDALTEKQRRKLMRKDRAPADTRHKESP